MYFIYKIRNQNCSLTIPYFEKVFNYLKNNEDLDLKCQNLK